MATSVKDGASDGGSCTPSDVSDSDDRSDRSRDSDYETDEEDVNRSTPKLNIQWTGYAKKTPMILFNSETIFNKRVNMRTVGERYHMAYKFGNSECKIVRTILSSHGFHEVHPNSSDYNIIWTGAHLKPFTLRSLSEFQKINHFPRSYELTRKDRLFKNIQRMQQIKGAKNFDIIPASYVLPGEYQEFCTAFLKDKGPWIVKPVASSRGRGIFLVNHPDQIPLDENIIVCRYVHNPLLIDGFKFDVRLYVAVTSYDPLCIYLYEEGLTRFATVKYEKSNRHIRNHCMHLTNYSVNKKNDEYVRNDDADVEDYGNKWSLGAMLRYLRSNGKDTAALMMKIEDVIIKTIMSVELPIATACKMFMPFRGNCFELYGFDILIDDNLKPWVLEVNLSPSLACDSPLDLKIKGNMLCDLFSMSGIICHDPMMRTMQQSRRNQDVASKMAARAKVNPSVYLLSRTNGKLGIKIRPRSAKSSRSCRSSSSNTRVVVHALGHYNHKLSIEDIDEGLMGKITDTDKFSMRTHELIQTRDGNPIRAYDSFKRACERAEVSKPQNITRTNLRTYMSTLAQKQRPSSASSLKKGSDNARDPAAATNKSMAGLNSEEIRVVRRTKEEESRKGGWVRIFPTADSWDLYSTFLQFTTSHNLMLHQKLYPERHKSNTSNVAGRGSTSAGTRAKSAYIQLANSSGSVKPTIELANAYAQAMLRTKRYERKLGKRTLRNRRRKRAETRRDRRKLAQGVAEESGEENENEDQEENEDDEPPITERNISERNNQMSQKITSKETPQSSAQREEVIEIVVDKNSKENSKSEPRTERKLTGLKALARNNSVPDRSQHSHGESGKDEIDGAIDARVEEMDKPPPEPLQPEEPKYNVVELLQKGRTLNKVQARTAFAMYLVRVQQRLMADCNNLNQDDIDGLNEQMDLVLRFLKRAAVNLQQSFKVVVPSRKLPLNDRRRILAKQLGDFVHIYNKETEQLRARRQLEKKHTLLRRAESLEGLEEDKFDRFVHTASEAELEEVLTTYTKINKSASIFLGSKTGSDTQTAQHVPTTGNSLKHIGATSSAMRPDSSHRRKDSLTSTDSVQPPKTITGWEEVPKAIHSVPTSSSDLRSHSSQNPQGHSHGHASGHAPGAQPRPTQATYSTNSAASYASAVQIYTQKLSSFRPRSASSTVQKTEKQTRSRPSSAHISRQNMGPPINYSSTTDLQGGFRGEYRPKDPYNEKVISEALQRLAMRQQARQYSPFNGTSLVPSDNPSRPTSATGQREVMDKTWIVHDSMPPGTGTLQLEKGSGDRNDYSSPAGRYVAMEDHISKARPPSGIAPKRVHSAIDSKTLDNKLKKQTTLNLQSADATFNSFIEDSGQGWNNDLAMVYNQVTGVVPQNYHTPSQSSKQYQILQQQALKQQSKVLLEQSKAKHQAMIAQAHASQKSQGKGESEAGLQMYAPKPPVKPGTNSRKSASAYHRVTRRAPEETSLNFQFYSSGKPSVNGGW